MLADDSIAGCQTSGEEGMLAVCHVRQHTLAVSRVFHHAIAVEVAEVGPLGPLDDVNRGGLVCLNSAARFDKWNRAAVR